MGRIALFLILVQIGCSSGSESTPTAPGEDVTEADGTAPADTEAPDSETPPPPGSIALDFKLATGDDGKACQGNDHCAIFMSLSSTRALEVVATADGKVASDVAVSWSITKAPNDALKISALSSTTDATGMAQVEAKQTGGAAAQYEITATAQGATNAKPLVFDVLVTSKGQVPLSVAYTYTGKRSFQGVTTLLFKQDAGAPTCATLNPADLPAANTQAGPKALSQSTHFPSLPDLETEKQQKYTIVGLGADNGKPPLVWGCNDADGAVDVEKPGTTVTIPLGDLPPSWKGVYDVTTRFDLVSALPKEVEDVVNVILGLFTDPAGQLMVLGCKFGGDVGVLSDFCGYAFVDAKNPCIEQSCYKSVGLAVKSLVEKALNSLLKDNLGGDIFFTGQDVAKILKDLELKAAFEFKNEPGPGGEFGAGDTSADWHSVTYRWTLGNNCEPDDDACGKYSINVAAFQGGPITAAYSGNVDYATGEPLLTINTHAINLKYGQLAKWIVEKEILPRIAGDGTDGSPKVDSFEKLIKSLLGGKECLKLDDCCEKFKAFVAADGGVTADIAKAACDALIPLAVGQLDKYLDGLDTGSGENFTIATKEPCKCADFDANMTIDTWGSKTAPCHWDTSVKVGGVDAKIENDFWAVEQQ